MNRALRRFYAERWKNRTRKRMEFWGWGSTPRAVGINAKARKMCSWYCCGSRRRYDGLSLQEQKQLASFEAQLEEYGL